MDKNLAGKTAVVTGGSRGIGRAIAGRLAERGASVVFTYLQDEKSATELVASITANGGSATAICADMAVPGDIDHLFESVMASHGRLDILINNAGISMRALFEDLDLDVFRKIMDINFYGTVYLTKYALPHILASRGTIVGVSSINGHRGTPARTAYTA